MGGYRLGALLFFYEILRVLLLVVFLLIAPPDSSVNGAFFPYLVYLSSNALFPLMVLFVWLKPDEHRNFLNLFIAGKVVGVVSFYAWELFSVREFPGVENVVKSMVVLGGSVFISLADVLSVWGAWTFKNKLRQTPVLPLDPSA